MPSLRDTLHHALAAGNTDRELAEALLRSDALSQALHLAASTDEDLQAQLGYTKSSLRAQLSKARRRLPSSFPLPILEGRWWLSSDITEYRTEHSRRPSTATHHATTDNASSTITAGNTRTARTDMLDSSTGNAGT